MIYAGHLPEVFRLLKRLRYKSEGDFLRQQKISKIANSLLIVYGQDLWHAESVSYQKLKMRKYRARKYCNDIFAFNERVYFATLTFKNEYIENCSEQTLIRYVREFLQSHCNDYLANGDYGSLNSRFHAHALIGDPHDLNDWHKYGSIHYELSKGSEVDKKRLSRYVTKLTNHAYKENTCKPFHKRGVKNIALNKLDNLPF